MDCNCPLCRVRKARLLFEQNVLKQRIEMEKTTLSYLEGKYSVIPDSLKLENE
jgi:hypothetical protein